MTGVSCLTLGRLLASLKDRKRSQVFASSAFIADRRVTIECDDQRIFPDFFDMFGGPRPVSGPLSVSSDMHLDVRACIHPDFGWFRMSGSNDLPVDAQELNFAVELEQGMFRRLPVGEEGWMCFSFRGSDAIALAFRGRDCLFALGPMWRSTIMWYLFWRLLRIRSDAIFFHASALGIFGDGTIFVGPGGAGKSTLALALAARGHNFLGDEVAGYLPARGELVPFRRPVGVKPGPRSAAVGRSLGREAVEKIAHEGVARFDIDSLLSVEPPRPVPLRRIVFLRGFSEQPSFEHVTPGREEIVALQPLMSSFLNASHRRRIFQLTRLLSGSAVYRLRLGEPDATAAFVEQEFARE